MCFPIYEKNRFSRTFENIKRESKENNTKNDTGTKRSQKKLCATNFVVFYSAIKEKKKKKREMWYSKAAIISSLMVLFEKFVWLSKQNKFRLPW